jgi:hypothetical protein
MLLHDGIASINLHIWPSYMVLYVLWYYMYYLAIYVISVDLVF